MATIEDLKALKNKKAETEETLRNLDNEIWEAEKIIPISDLIFYFEEKRVEVKNASDKKLANLEDNTFLSMHLQKIDVRLNELQKQKDAGLEFYHPFWEHK